MIWFPQKGDGDDLRMVLYASEFFANIARKWSIQIDQMCVIRAPHPPRTAFDLMAAVDVHNYISTPFPATYFVHTSFYSTWLYIPC